MLKTRMQSAETRNRLNSQGLIVAVAIRGDSKSKHLVRWALEKFSSHEHVVFKLLHVHSDQFGEISSPVLKEQEHLAAVCENQLDWKTREMLSAYKHLFDQKQVQSDVVMIQSDNVAWAISQAVSKHRIKKLVIGASAFNVFTRKVKKNNLASRISEIAPRFCRVYQISQGKLSSIRPSDVAAFESIRFDNPESGWSTGYQSISPPSSKTDITSLGTVTQFQSSSLAMQRLHALSTVNQTLCIARTGPLDTNRIGLVSWDVEEIEKDFLGSSSRSGSETTEIIGRGNS